MPTKTDRIISYLPGTFRALPRPTALYTLVNAFGNELQQGENSLAALMQAHWVDHADRGSEVINDLLKIAAMYGLSPREDEDVEEFREHLKRYIRIFLEGTTTVQGILRVTAQTLGVQIADAYEDMDTWWTRDSDLISTLRLRRDDAALILLGSKSARVFGRDARSAQIMATLDLGEGVDLRENNLLKLKVDQDAPIEIDLASQSSDPANVSLDNIIQAINAAFPPDIPTDVATAQDQYLLLSSPTVGIHSKLELLENKKDASATVLGIAPRTYYGKESQAASVTGVVGLGNGVDLSQQRYLRLLVDNTHLFEVDCAGTDPSNSTLEQISDAINIAFGFPLASHDGYFLTLTSATTGFTSSIGFLQAAAQDAKGRLFGTVNTFYTGQSAQAARATSVRDLSAAVDLSKNFNIRVETDTIQPITINCAGFDSANTQLPEIVAAINAALGPGMATQNGRFVSLQSSTVGADSLVFFRAPKHDASGLIFGIGERVYKGDMAKPAHFVASPPVLSQSDECLAESGCLDISTVRFLDLAIDGQPATLINLAEELKQQGKDPRNATLNDIAGAVNHAMGDVIAKVVDDHLELVSPSTGASSRLLFKALQKEQQSRFVTRAWITDEASELVFGFNARETYGTAATSAQVIGKIDLRYGIDLSETSLLRLMIDGGSAVEINCAGSRPRATLIGEIVTKINAAVGVDKFASDDGRYLLLNSPASGAGSRIVFETPRGSDAIDILLDVDAGLFRGSEPSGVRFEATQNINETLDLSSASRIKLGIDGAEPIEIDCAGTDPAATRLNEILIAINLALEMTVASRNGDRIVLLSPSSGESSQIEFMLPGSGDATRQILGIEAPRRYQGNAATPAKITGEQDLSAGIDLQIARFLQLSIDASPVIVIDCASEAENAAAVGLAEIVAAVNAALQAEIASVADGKYLQLTSSTRGISSRINLQYHTGADARTRLFGEDVPERSNGVEAESATLIGEVDLLSPADLSERSMVRLAVDGGAPEDIDLAGVAPATTFLDEIITAINAVFPGMASQTEDDRLTLSVSLAVSGSSGEQSRLALLPSRHLELIEYPPETQQFLTGEVSHGMRWLIINKGVADVLATAQLTTQQGVSGPGLVNMTTGWRLFLPIVLGPAEAVKICFDKNGEIQATVRHSDGSEEALSAAEIIIRPPFIDTSPSASTVMSLPRGKSDWVYTDCISSRFNEAAFDQNVFAGGECREWGVFNVSRFPDESVKFPKPVFAAKAVSPSPGVEVTFDWTAHLPGSFTVNLPADLPARFGGRFNEARFGQARGAPEAFNAAVTEPDTDSQFIGNLFQQDSRLVAAKQVDFVPLGWEAVTLPFRKPMKLTLGTQDRPARLYLIEQGLDGFIEVSAQTLGGWGNDISMSARSSGPAMFDIAVFYQGARFENARQTVLGEPLKKRVAETLEPGAIGVLQAKAAGVRARVTRDNN